jgi:ribosomal protein S12 methylthiotransferase accessory factor
MIIDINFEEDGRIVPTLGHREITMNESPFLIFLASAGMCSAVYVKAFCRQRKIPLNRVKISQIMQYAPKKNLVTAINIQLELDEDFPEKYKEALTNVVALCPIKKHLVTPPEFNVITESYLVNC